MQVSTEGTRASEPESINNRAPPEAPRSLYRAKLLCNHRDYPPLTAFSQAEKGFFIKRKLNLNVFSIQTLARLTKTATGFNQANSLHMPACSNCSSLGRARTCHGKRLHIWWQQNAWYQFNAALYSLNAVKCAWRLQRHNVPNPTTPCAECS